MSKFVMGMERERKEERLFSVIEERGELVGRGWTDPHIYDSIFFILFFIFSI